MVALIIGALIASGAALGWLADHVGRGWAEMVDRDLTIDDPEATKADALIPELAAARRGPRIDGGCGCAACRKRPTEPCSDFDGD